MNFRLTFTLLLTTFSLIAQKVPDSLIGFSYKELYEKFHIAKKKEFKDFYASVFLFKAKKENIRDNILQGYYMKANVYTDSRVLIYCDSVITLSENNSNKYFPTNAYYVKAEFHFNRRNFRKALDNSLKSLEFSKKNKYKKKIAYNNLLIGIVKSRIQEHQEAVKILRSNYLYSKRNNIKSCLLPSLFALASEFKEIKKLDSATYYNKLGVQESKENKIYRNYFRLNEGAVLFYKNKYSEALDSINKSISKLVEIDDKPNLAASYYYKAKIHQNRNEIKEMLFNLKNVDTIFNIINDLHPKYRETYKILISYYKKNNQPKKQLYYINRLIRLDSILHENEVYLNKNLINKYDIPNLVSEKEKIINSLKQKDKSKTYILLVVCLITVLLSVLVYYQYNRRKLYKKRYSELIENEKNANSNENNIQKDENSNLDIGISDIVVNDIINKLNEFETNNMFLSSELTSSNLAKDFETNVKYLSKIVNHYKRKSFIHYINDLRIEYTINRLKSDENFKKYTLKAIANEVGFKKSESFSKAFKNYSNISPVFFIKELNKTS